MQKIKIISIGKTKEKWLQEAISEYTKRLSPYAQIESIWGKDDDHLLKLLINEKNIICLDPFGQEMNSEEFSQFLQASLLEGGSRLTFVIGGAEGLPLILRQKYPLLSLSKLTFTHQFARLLLIEQIYRAFEISKGTKYHK